MKEQDEFNRSWILEKAINEVLPNYEEGELTLRGLHYRLVSLGMTNTFRHYKRVVTAMIKARWDGDVSFTAFSDLDREMQGETKAEETRLADEISKAKNQIELWMTSYGKNTWENQNNYVEVLIEKKALQNVLYPVCEEFEVGLGACKGYPSLTFLYDCMYRYRKYYRLGKNLIILYMGDYDPSGEDIPRSIVDNIHKMSGGEFTIDLQRIALNEDQVISMGLPPAPVKGGDSRSASWDGLGQVELDAIEPSDLRDILRSALEDVFDPELYDELQKQESEEKEEYITELKNYVKEL